MVLPKVPSCARDEREPDLFQGRQRSSLEGKSAELAAGDQLTVLPEIEGNFAGGDAGLRDFSISLGDGKAIAGSGYRLPMVWQGRQAGSADGNPLTANGKAVRRIDAIWPDDPNLVANYVPLKWDGTRWFSKVACSPEIEPSARRVPGASRVRLSS